MKVAIVQVVLGVIIVGNYIASVVSLAARVCSIGGFALFTFLGLMFAFGWVEWCSGAVWHNS